MAKGQIEPIQQFAYWMGKALATLRTAEGVNRPTIAGRLGKDQKTIDRLEDGNPVDGNHRRYSLGQNIDRYVMAYASELKIDDARQIWKAAVDMWIKEGQAPDLTLLDDNAVPRPSVGRHARAALQRLAPGPFEGKGIPSASRRRRRGAR